MLGNLDKSSNSTAAGSNAPRKFALSSATVAIALYLLINGGMQFADFKAAQRQSTRIGQTTVTQQAFEGAASLLQQNTAAPKVALLGSSLVLAPFWSSDLAHFKGVADCWHHHKSMFMEQLLATAGLPKTDVINFGLPGLVVSDAYLITEKLFKEKGAPAVLFYGIAPRDFMDDFLGAHTQTPLFEKLVTVQDALLLGDLYFSTPEERMDFVLQKVIYMYGKRGKYQTRVARTLNKAADKVFASNSNSTAPEDDARALGFLQEQNRPYVWAASIREYKARYKTFNEVQFERQKRFLDALLKVSKERGIATVLVNMPLTPDNMKLMPPGLYERYMSAVHELVATNKAPFIDLQNNDHYPDEYFYDTVHLNARGGDKMSLSLAQYMLQLKQNSQVAEHGGSQ